MDKDQYLRMIEGQLEEALDIKYDAQKKLDEANARYLMIVKMKQDYLKWVVEK